MIGNVKMQTIKRRTGRSLTGDRPLFLALIRGNSLWPTQIFKQKRERKKVNLFSDKKKKIQH